MHAGDFSGVERWLLKAEEMMRKSLSTITRQALEVGHMVHHEMINT